MAKALNQKYNKACNVRAFGGEGACMNEINVEINFYPKKEHFIKFYTYLFYNSPNIKKDIELKRNFVSGGILVGMMAFYLLFELSPGTINYEILFSILFLPCILSASFVFITLPHILKFSYFRHIKKISKKNMKIYKNPFRIHLNDKDISFAISEQKLTVKWSGIKKLVKNGNFIYIFYDVDSAIIIPMSAFDSKTQFDNLYKKILHIYQNACT